MKLVKVEGRQAEQAAAFCAGNRRRTGGICLEMVRAVDILRCTITSFERLPHKRVVLHSHLSLVLCLGLLFGCKPKESKPEEIKVAGQIFIVTKGAESIKLGGVEILCVDQKRIKEFIASRRHEIEIKSGALQAQSDSAMAEMRKASSYMVAKGTDESIRQSERTIANVEKISAVIEHYPGVKDYLTGFSPNTAPTAQSDADGRFTVSYAPGLAMSIIAVARRSAIDREEVYGWVINAPTNSPATPLLLNNGNLASVDPDGYFPIKPKE